MKRPNLHRHPGSHPTRNSHGNRESGQARLTGPGMLLLFLIGVGIIGFALWKYKLVDFETLFQQTPSTSGSSSSGSGGSTGAGPTGALRRVQSTGVLRVGMEPEAPPLHFINDSMQEDGFDFRLATAIAKRMGLQRVQVVEADYEKLPDMLRRGDIDIIMAGYVPDPSIAGVDWTNGYLDFGLCMIVHENLKWQIRELGDLNGKTVAIYDDPAAERFVKNKIARVNVKKFSGDNGWFEAVERGQAEALIYDYPFASVEIKQHPQTVIVKYNLNTSKYAIGVPANNYDLVYELNKALDHVTAQPAYADLMRQYLSSTSEVFMQPVKDRNSYVVKPGDTLSLIAQRKLGSPDRWPDIWRLNTERVANPNLIYPKLVLIMP
ncbi:MAG: transporter substrate-binding and LysM peptidoglycan-binding domain-containing protein [Terriglobales bacterium]